MELGLLNVKRLLLVFGNVGGPGRGYFLELERKVFLCPSFWVQNRHTNTNSYNPTTTYTHHETKTRQQTMQQVLIKQREKLFGLTYCMS